MPPASTSPTSTATSARRSTILSFVISFPFLLIHGIISNRAFPALCLLPLGGSALLSAFLIYRDRVAAIGSPIQSLSPSNVFFADILLAVFLLVVLIPSWISLSKAWYDNGLIILGTYGTVFPMVNLAIHLYFVALQVLHMVTARSCNCAHCQSVMKKGSFMGVVSEYTPLSEGDIEEEDAYRDIESGNGRTSL